MRKISVVIFVSAIFYFSSVKANSAFNYSFPYFSCVSFADSTDTIYKLTLSSITDTFPKSPSGVQDYLGYNFINSFDTTFPEPNNHFLDTTHQYGGWYDHSLIDKLPLFNARILRFATSQGDWDWSNGWYKEDDIIENYNKTFPPLNQPDYYSCFNPYFKIKDIRVSDRVTDMKFLMDGNNCEYMYEADIATSNNNFSNPDSNYEMLQLKFANQLKLNLNFVELGNEYWAAGTNNYDCVMPNGQSYISLANHYLDFIHQFDITNNKNIHTGVDAFFSSNSIDESLNGSDDQNCRVYTWNSVLNFPKTCLSCSNEFHLNKGDALIFHIYGSSGIAATNNGFSTFTFPQLTDMPYYFAKPFSVIDAFKSYLPQVLPANADAWVTEYNVDDGTDGVVTEGTWANGLYMAAMTLAFMEVPQVNHIIAFNLEYFDRALFRISDNKAGHEFSRSPDEDVKKLKTEPWSLTGSGICVSIISEAMRNAYSATKIKFPSSVPNLENSVYPVLYGWRFNGVSGTDSDEQLILVNFDGKFHSVNIDSIMPHVELNYQQISPGLVTVIDENLNTNTYDPRVFITGLGNNEMGTALFYNDGHLYGRSDENSLVPQLNSKDTLLGSFHIVSLPPYSITRVYQIHNDIVVTANHDSSFTSGTTNNDGIAVQNGATQLSASGASYYLWSPVNNLRGGAGTELYAPQFITLNNTIYAKSSSVVIDPTVTTTYYVTGYDANNNVVGSTKTISVNIINTNSSLNLSLPSVKQYFSNCSGVQLTPLGNASDYWWSPTAGLFSNSTIVSSIIHTTSSSPSIFAKPIAKTIYTVIGLDKSTGFFAVRTDTIIPTDTIPIVAYQYPNTVIAGETICNSTPLNNFSYSSSVFFKALTTSGFNTVNWTELLPAYKSFSNSNPTSLIPVDTFGGSTLIQASASNSSGCTVYGFYKLNINPSVSISAYKNEICTGEVISLNALGSSNGAFQWIASGSNKNDISCSSGYPCGTAEFYSGASGKYDIKVTETSYDSNCLSSTNSAEKEITVLSNSLPKTSITPNNVDILRGCGCITLKASSQGSSTAYWSWYPVQNFKNGSNYNSNQVTVCPTTTTTYFVNEINTDSINNPNGCCGSANVTVNIVPTSISCDCNSGSGNCYLGNGTISIDTVVEGEQFQWYYSNGTNAVPLNINNSVYAINLNIAGLTDNAGNYWAVETLNGCSATSNIVQVQQGNCPSKPEITVYPNPTSNLLTIVTQAQALNVQVVNIVGQVIQEYSWYSGQSQQTIDVSKLTSGIYLIELQTKNGTLAAKFVRD